MRETLGETSAWLAVKAVKHYTEAVKCLSAGGKKGCKCFESDWISSEQAVPAQRHVGFEVDRYMVQPIRGVGPGLSRHVHERLRRPCPLCPLQGQGGEFELSLAEYLSRGAFGLCQALPSEHH
jgi:hypothetical protein